MNVFKEAKCAYQERKAEIASTRRLQERPAQPRRAYTIDEGASTTSSHRSRRDPNKPRTHHKRRHSGEASKTLYPAQEAVYEHAPQSPFVQNYSMHSPQSPTSPTSPGRIIWQQTARGPHAQESYFPPVPIQRSMSTGNIDMDLAYGEPPPNLFKTGDQEEVELQGLVGRVKGLLDEANCLQYTATQTISHLQRSPDAMAAVALTLAEISSLVKKMSPMVIFKLKSAAPAVFALLVSPQFMIAGGVAVGVTIVAFGGYKIVKKIQERKEIENDSIPERMIEVPADMSRIDTWQRGIAVAEAESVGTSVDGEFITPTAAYMSKLNLMDDFPASDIGSATRRKSKSRSGARSEKTEKTSKSRAPKSTTSSASHKSSKTHKTKTGEEKVSSGKSRTQGWVKEKEKKPSPLRLMFT
jgi:hypothetical protein